MNACILVEGNFDGMLLAMLIGAEQEKYEIEIRVAGGASAAFSYARTLLATKRTPVAILIDADSIEPEVAEARRQDAEEVIGESAAGVPFRVLVAVPELEVLFFERPDLLRRVFAGQVTDHLLELGRLSPRRILERLAQGKSIHHVRVDVLREINTEDHQALRNTTLIRELLEFIQVATRFVAEASG